MATERYGTKFSVLAVPERQNMFLMNMRVYDMKDGQEYPEGKDLILGSQRYKTHMIGDSNEPCSVIWCAVYNVGWSGGN